MAEQKGNDGTVAEAVDAEPGTAEERRALVAKEYGQWVAVEPISHGGTRAYNVGDPVPATNVSRWGYEARGQVAKAGSKAAEDAVARRAQRRRL